MSAVEGPGVRFPRIRPLAAGDAPRLAALWVASWREAMPAIDFAARRPWLLDLLADPAVATLVAADAERPDAPLGFASLRAGGPRGTVLEQIAVARHAKGGGAAGALLDAAKARAPGGLALEVNQANGRALRFYGREGFARRGAGRNPASGLATWHMEWRPG